MSEERARILQMVSEGKASAEEGAKMLDALRTGPSEPLRARRARARWFHVRVSNAQTGKPKVNVNLPLGLVRAGLKMGARFSSELNEVDFEEILIAIQEGAAGKLVEVEDAEGGERVEIYVD